MAELAAIKEVRRLLLLNFISYVLLAMSGAVLIDDAIDTGYDISDGYVFPEWTAASGFANLLATVAGVVGAAAVLPGLYHVRAWSQESLPAAASTGFMAWLLTLLTQRLTIKEAIMAASEHDYKLGSTEIFLGGIPYTGFAMIMALLVGLLSVTQLCYLSTIFSTGS